MISGTCTACAVETWKIVRDPKTGERYPLWPRPDSRYPVYQTADGHQVRGIGFCGGCCPAVGAPGPDSITASVWEDGQRKAVMPIRLGTVVAIEEARDRYQYWLSETHGTFLRAWLHDHLAIDTVKSGTLTAIMDEWHQDATEERAAVVAERDDGRPDD